MLHVIKRIFSRWFFFQESKEIRQQIAQLLKESSPSKTDLTQEERHIIQNVLDLHEMTVEDAMTPRADIVALPLKINLKELKAFLAQHPYSRYPVYEENLDDIKGVIHIKDVYKFGEQKSFNLKDILQEILFVPHSSELPDLLAQMRLTKISMALVVDEYGGVDGLVTPADIMEEILGRLPNPEMESDQPQFKYLAEGFYEVDARWPMEEFEEVFGKLLTEEEEEEEIETVGGLVVALAGRVPARKEVISHSSGLEFEILEANPRSVLKVVIRCPFPLAKKP